MGNNNLISQRYFLISDICLKCRRPTKEQGGLFITPRWYLQSRATFTDYGIRMMNYRISYRSPYVSKGFQTMLLLGSIVSDRK